MIEFTRLEEVLDVLREHIGKLSSSVIALESRVSEIEDQREPLTKRERIALVAMEAIIREAYGAKPDWVAKKAFDFADAMIAESERGK